MAKTWKSLGNRGSGFGEIDGTVLGFNIPGRIAQCSTSASQSKVNVSAKKAKIGWQNLDNDKCILDTVFKLFDRILELVN